MNKIHSWTVTILMSVICWKVVDVFIVKLTFLEFIFIEFLMVMTGLFCTFVDNKYLKETEVKPEDKEG